MSASGGIADTVIVRVRLRHLASKATVQSIEAMSEMFKGDLAAPLEIEAKPRERLMLFDTPGLVGIAFADTWRGHSLFLLYPS